MIDNYMYIYIVLDVCDVRVRSTGNSTTTWAQSLTRIALLVYMRIALQNCLESIDTLHAV